MSEILYPYDLLSKYGVSPSSTAKAVQDLEFVPSTREESEAWRVLCKLPSRLKVDFFLYQGESRDKLSDFQRYLNTIQHYPSVAEVYRLLDVDAPIILLLMGQRCEAEKMLKQWQKQHPDDGRITHQLALLYYVKAQHYEEMRKYDEANEAWRLTIANWTRTLADDLYWETWCLKRQLCYGNRSVDYLSDSLKADVRSDLQQYLAREFSDYADRYLREDNLSRAEVHRDLEICYTIERQSAKALKAAGGLSINGNEKLICGVLLLGELGLESRLSELVAETQRQLDDYKAMDPFKALEPGKEPKVSSELIKQLRLYFSQLATAAVLINLDRLEQAMLMLPSVPKTPEDFDGQSPAYCYLEEKAQQFCQDLAELAIHAQIAIARHAITSPTANLSTAMMAWREAIKWGQKGGIERKATVAISDLAIGRVQALQAETTRNELERLDEAIVLLEAAETILCDVDKGEIVSSLVDALTSRGQWRLNSEDYRGAVEDLKRAFDLYPNHVNVRNELCQALINYADNRIEANQEAMARTLLERARNLAKVGLRQHPDSESLKISLQSAQSELDVLEGKVLKDDGWAALEKALAVTNLTGYAERQTNNAVGEAIQLAESKEEAGNYLEAIADLERALQLVADYNLAQTILTHICLKWAEKHFKRMISTGAREDLKEAKEIMELGLRYSPDHSRLRLIQKQILLTEELLGGEAK
ncbi:MAG: hypothetical protein AB1489_21160 [Acidobacteriota bacterium]